MSAVFKSDKLNDDLQTILDTFSGADGAVSFVKLRLLLANLEEHEIAGDESAREILNVLRRFRKLIDAAQKENR